MPSWEEAVLARKILFAFCLLSWSATAAEAATYYIVPTGSDSGSGSSSAPWATFGKAWGTLQPGDTLILKDGTYTQALKPTVSGTAGGPIIIRAEHDGQAILDGQSNHSGISIDSRQYLTIEGLLSLNPGESPALTIQAPDGNFTATHDIVVRRTGARGGVNLGNNGAAIEVARVTNVLLEDVWAYGFGRYALGIYGSQHVTVRRAVIRWDRWDGTNYKPCDPKFNMGVYDTHDSTFENLLLLDGGTASCGDHGALYVPGNDNGNTAPYTDSDNNRFLGMIMLNNSGVGVNVEGGSGGTNDNNQFANIVSWGNSSAGLDAAHSAKNTLFEHATVGKNAYGSYFGDSSNNVSGTVCRNNAFVSNAGLGLRNSDCAGDYNIASGNNPNYAAAPAAHDLSSDPGIKYVTRIEAGTAGKATASDGSDRGATVMDRYQDGVLTSSKLWPWPNEARILQDMCNSAFLSTVGRTGANAPPWCSSGKSLTQYIWEAAGNPIPSDIYGGGGTQPPGSACDLNQDSATNISDVQLAVNQAIGTAACTADLNKDGACNVIDVQRVVNAALGGTCVSSP